MSEICADELVLEVEWRLRTRKAGVTLEAGMREYTLLEMFFAKSTAGSDLCLY